MNIREWMALSLEGKEIAFPETVNFNVNGYSLKDALRTHIEWVSNWKKKAIASKGAPLNLDETRADDRCILGSWLNSMYSRFQDMNEFQYLFTKHRDFHEAAAKIVELHNNKKFTAALNEARSVLPRLSLDIADALEAFFKVVMKK